MANEIGLSRRTFILAAGAGVLGACQSQQRHIKTTADFRYRLGLSQPLDSPNYLRLKDMADRVFADTDGAMQIDVHGGSVLGSDNAMLGMLQKGELELYMGGNVFGPHGA